MMRTLIEDEMQIDSRVAQQPYSGSVYESESIEDSELMRRIEGVDNDTDEECLTSTRLAM